MSNDDAVSPAVVPAKGDSDSPAVVPAKDNSVPPAVVPAKGDSDFPYAVPAKDDSVSPAVVLAQDNSVPPSAVPAQTADAAALSFRNYQVALEAHKRQLETMPKRVIMVLLDEWKKNADASAADASAIIASLAATRVKIIRLAKYIGYGFAVIAVIVAACFFWAAWSVHQDNATIELQKRKIAMQEETLRLMQEKTSGGDLGTNGKGTWVFALPVGAKPTFSGTNADGRFVFQWEKP